MADDVGMLSENFNKPLKTFLPSFIATVASTFSYLCVAPASHIPHWWMGSVGLLFFIHGYSHERKFEFVFVCKSQEACLRHWKYIDQDNIGSPVKMPVCWIETCLAFAFKS